MFYIVIEVNEELARDAPQLRELSAGRAEVDELDLVVVEIAAVAALLADDVVGLDVGVEDAELVHLQRKLDELLKNVDQLVLVIPPVDALVHPDLRELTAINVSKVFRREPIAAGIFAKDEAHRVRERWCMHACAPSL